ncbi:hypothetical protein [Mesomycoplasma lagogenitalium]|uniref:Uncharacterized protein n=1 Tax=Mesomycoplasma lagogenitalium TaxID=171286 RepID=A0ABY8LT92_9BACT|nr:hypothetical protein [Mesomycoplasma lagogenitalium]WGI36456.1 hypothetical protein QEG99_03255 [Mesomycoplasma lagogenitalium]
MKKIKFNKNETMGTEFNIVEYQYNEMKDAQRAIQKVNNREKQEELFKKLSDISINAKKSHNQFQKDLLEFCQDMIKLNEELDQVLVDEENKTS